MNAFDEALVQVIDVMLSQNNCEAENSVVRDKLVILLRKRLRIIAVTTSNLACHAGRTAPCYFDLECAFRRLRITTSGLLEFHYTRSEKYPPVVNFNACQTRDVDIHQMPLLDITQQDGKQGGLHIPEHIPPFPGQHTYKNTRINIATDRGYFSERERSALLNQNAQRALNKFYLRTQPKMSLFNEPQSGTDFMVLISNKFKKPAYMSALKPRNEVFDVDIYEFNDKPSGLALTNPFLKEPKEYYVIKHADVEINEDRPMFRHDENDSEQECNQEVEEENKQGSPSHNAKDNENQMDNEKDSEKDNELDNVKGSENGVTYPAYWEMPNLNIEF